MRLIKGLPLPATFPNGCVLTIGNFDGVHLGHKMLIDNLAHQGRELGLPIVAMTFEPQPMEFFLGAKAPPRLTRLREKVIGLKNLPVDDLIVVRFNSLFAGLDAEQFINEILINRFNVKYLVVGDDFHFGKNRQGDYSLLKQSGEKQGFVVADSATFKVNGERVSSTAIRNALGNGDLTSAEAMLGYRYSVCGRVVHGSKRGRELGFPTANINLSRKSSPISGVFAVTMSGVDNLERKGIANIGVRPTVDGSNKVVLETHLFDFNSDIYGCHVNVHFIHKIRDEQRFNSIGELKAQISADVAQAHRIFALTD